MARRSSPALLPLQAVCLLLVFASLCEACEKLKLRVPSRIEAGTLIGKVNIAHCLHSNHLVVRSNDPDIIAEDDGSLYARHGISMSKGKKTFTLHLLDPDTHAGKKVTVKLIHKKKPHKTRIAREAILRRTKRRWAPQPTSVMENALGPYPLMVQQIQSDTQQNYTIYYSINGPGVDQPPLNLFYIIRETGVIYINKPVDREEYSQFNLIGNARTIEGYSPEQQLVLIIKVEDENDNAPQFTEEQFCDTIYEHSRVGVVVGRVNATDRDEPGSIHTKLKYSIVSQFPVSPRMFAMDADTGIITTTSDQLDREHQDNYLLIIRVQDMNGQPFGLSSTGTMSITVTDINDNPPTFLASSYQAEVYENESNVTILHVPVKDDDLINTTNWRAVFSILQGNERGQFQIVTDAKTNDGLLMVVKPLNYEEKNIYQLQVGVTNEANMVTKGGAKIPARNTVPVTVRVKNVDEGPEFQPSVLYMRVQEGQPIGTLVGLYTAIDPETKSSDGISYKKLSDPSSWVNIDSSSGQITTATVLDRESSVGKSQYNVTVLATDKSGKNGTGTVVITVDDVNDNNPTIIGNSQTVICVQNRRPIQINAQDLDDRPNSAPLKFSLNDSSNPTIRNQWKLTQQNGTSATLEDIASQPIGSYLVPVLIVDQQGKGLTNNMEVTICDCPNGRDCPSSTGRLGDANVSLGPWAILTMVLSAVLLALLLFFLLKCLCGGGSGKSQCGFPDDMTEHNLIVSNTEAPGAEVMEGHFHKRSAHVAGQAPSASGTIGKGSRSGEQGGQQHVESIVGGKHTRTIEQGGQQTMEFLPGGQQTMEFLPGGQQTIGSLRRGQYTFDSGRYTYSEWQKFMQVRIGEKLYLCGQDEEHERADDYVLPYHYEGKGSLAGSVGCCSDIQGDEDRLEFSKNLEPKFRTLADICTKK